MAGNTVEVTDASFSEAVLHSDKPVLEEIAAEHKDKITVAKLDVDANPTTARDYQVLSIPTLMVFKGGEKVKEIVGARPKAALMNDLADFLS
jgi:thioredoxin 1